MGKRILLADDSATIHRLAEMALDDTDYQLTCVSDGQAAVNQLGVVEPDLVLADALMPFLTGYEVCRRIKSDPRYAHLPVLLITGRFQPFDEALAEEVQIDGRVIKPFSQDQLIGLIQKYVKDDGPAADEDAGMLSPADGDELGAIDRAEVSFADLDIGETEPVEEPQETYGGLGEVDSTLRINPETLRAEAEALRSSVHREEAGGSDDDTMDLSPGVPPADTPFGDVSSFSGIEPEAVAAEEDLEELDSDDFHLEEDIEPVAPAADAFDEDDFLPREMPVTEPLPIEDDAVEAAPQPEDSIEELDELEEIEELEDEMIAHDDFDGADDIEELDEADVLEDELQSADAEADLTEVPPEEDRFLPLEQPGIEAAYTPPPESEREYLPSRDFSEDDTMELTTADLEEAGLDDLEETELRDVEPEPHTGFGDHDDEAIELDEADLVDETPAVTDPQMEDTQALDGGGEEYDTAPVGMRGSMDDSDAFTVDDEENDPLAASLDAVPEAYDPEPDTFAADAEPSDTLDEIDDMDDLEELDELDPGDALASSLDQADESLDVEDVSPDPFVEAPLDLGADEATLEQDELEVPDESGLLSVEEIEPPLVGGDVEDLAVAEVEDADDALSAPLEAALEENDDLLDLGDEPLAAAPPAEDEAEPEPVAAPAPVAVTPPAPAESAPVAAFSGQLDDKQLDILADKVAERLLNTTVPQSIREIVWQVVPELAEAMIKKRIFQLEQSVDDE